MIAAASGWHPASRLDQVRLDTVRAIDLARQEQVDAKDASRALFAHSTDLPPDDLWLRHAAVERRSYKAVSDLAVAYAGARHQVVADSLAAIMLDDLNTSLCTVILQHEGKAREYVRWIGGSPVAPDDDGAVCDDAPHLVNAPDDAWCVPDGTWAHRAQWTDTRSGQHVCTVLAAHAARTAAAAGSVGAAVADELSDGAVRPVQSFFPRGS